MKCILHSTESRKVDLCDTVRDKNGYDVILMYYTRRIIIELRYLYVWDVPNLFNDECTIYSTTKGSKSLVSILLALDVCVHDSFRVQTTNPGSSWIQSRMTYLFQREHYLLLLNFNKRMDAHAHMYANRVHGMQLCVGTLFYRWM